jgi:hypothetical protein
MHLVKICRTANHTVRLHMPLVLNGAVTADWIAQSLQHWISSWRECERQLRRFAPEKERRTSQGTQVIH